MSPEELQENAVPNILHDIHAPTLHLRPKRLKTSLRSSITGTPGTGPNPDINSEIIVVRSSLASPLITEEAEFGHTTSNTELQPGKLTKRQAERLEKQKLREVERIERERKKEEERKQKKEDREKKELERKQKREAVEKEKEERREQERLRREERRLKVEEEKRAKELERKSKEQERRQKDDERRKAEEMKDRSQMKISNFFAVKPARKEVAAANTASSALARSKPATPPLTAKELNNTSEADSYITDFLPFFQKRNVLLAPQRKLEPELIAATKLAFDCALTQQKAAPDLGEIFKSPPPTESKSFTSSQQMVDALNSSQMTEGALFGLVSNLPPVKYLQFYENAKPPYVGTWCSEKHLSTSVPPAQPLNTSATGLDYGYDSDLDWQEGDEGDEEDIDDLDEGDDEEDDAEDDEMEDFVENSETSKRGLVGPLQSVSVWNDGSHNEIFDELKYERLQLAINFPIDPFKDYWTTPKEAKDLNVQLSTELKENPVVSVTQLGTPVKTDVPEKNQTPNVLTPQKPIIKDKEIVGNLVEFIKNNNDFSIGTLSELAKKEFKVYTKSILKHTIQEIAFYNKKTSTWEIKDSSDTTARWN
ncbi:hypothetical protein METBIDRAFT_80107 [Metschnikowia bicuspidata var. bicuspidata NRRL YB-4993]|uniref:Chromatin assembly factor 1 subunit A n=1 Tax=Metschnikowia bicuspidata var. bicuspidata NRRL YB-4993 TaxID=869754 RepID=A0A1A0H262_9ASCO|nr:hypothetical protein METBIDRAFT_80107 [Metschnikowia bicuspidata var. bicuspidata NRRL YB-4993]OBA18012.1 hypothetical protein METBIDRAFT_80107 [Metschnikowia bicuspidata var. bicuspidata NRRL YB-4993]